MSYLTKLCTRYYYKFPYLLHMLQTTCERFYFSNEARSYVSGRHYLGTRFSGQHGLKYAPVAVVRVYVDVHHAPRRALVAEQVAAVDGFQSRFRHA